MSSLCMTTQALIQQRRRQSVFGYVCIHLLHANRTRTEIQKKLSVAQTQPMNSTDPNSTMQNPLSWVLVKVQRIPEQVDKQSWRFDFVLFCSLITVTELEETVQHVGLRTDCGSRKWKLKITRLQSIRVPGCAYRVTHCFAEYVSIAMVGEWTACLVSVFFYAICVVVVTYYGLVILRKLVDTSSTLLLLSASHVNKTKFLRPRPRPPEVNKGTSRI